MKKAATDNTPAGNGSQSSNLAYEYPIEKQATSPIIAKVPAWTCINGSVHPSPKTPAIAVLIASDGIDPITKKILPATVKGKILNIPSFKAVTPFVLTNLIT